MLEQIEKELQITLEDLLHNMESKFAIETSATTIHNALKKMKITWKNILPIPIQWNTPEIIRKHIEFVGTIWSQVEHYPKIYIDEKGWNMIIQKSIGQTLARRNAKLLLGPKQRN